MRSLESLGFRGIRRRVVYDTAGDAWDVDWAQYCAQGRGRSVDWSIPVYTGVTLAHLAAEVGILPPDFELWNLADNRGWTVAHVCARHDALPDDFDWWDLSDATGWSVAHELISYHAKRFEKEEVWYISDHAGWTVAHQGAQCGHLPPDFSGWDIADCDGRSVAYVAALRRAEKRAAAQVPWDIEGPVG